MVKSLVCLLLFHIFYSTVYAQKDFRKDYKFFEATESFYKFHPTHRTWFDAQKQCALEGASLWYPEDQAEANLVVNYWKEKQPLEHQLFIGISDVLSEGSFVTVDGRPVEDVWSNWGPGEPNNANYHGGENCVSLRRDWGTPGNLDLNDENCEKYPKQFICKKTLSTVEWNKPCEMPDPRYIYEARLGKCYRFDQKQMNWTEAFRVCTAEQSYLAVINSEPEKQGLVKMISDAFDSKIPEDLIYVHLGFHNKFGYEWQTVVGTPLVDSGWSVWGSGQPDGGVNNTCGAMDPLNGLYFNLGCDEKAVFICEHDISVLTHTITERMKNNNTYTRDDVFLDKVNI